MSHAITIAANFVAIFVLIFGIYFPRHRHRDMVVSYIGINVGVLAVATVLSSINASVGLGLGMFGVLSIIRVRSDELNQRQVAYYFASLAIGLLGGTKMDDPLISIGMMGLLVIALWFGDHPRLLGRYRVQNLTVDRALTSEPEAIAYLTQRLGVSVHGVTIRRVDFVDDTTSLELRYEIPAETVTDNRVTLDNRLAASPTNGAW